MRFAYDKTMSNSIVLEYGDCITDFEFMKIIKCPRIFIYIPKMSIDDSISFFSWTWSKIKPGSICIFFWYSECSFFSKSDFFYGGAQMNFWDQYLNGII